MGYLIRVRQILVNLLSNAVKFTSDGEVLVSVVAKRLEAGEISHNLDLENSWESSICDILPVYQIQFSFIDTGISIPGTRMNRLFESVNQVDSSTSREYGGTGLGLVISKRLTEMMGGQMWVESMGVIDGIPSAGYKLLILDGKVSSLKRKSGSTFYFRIVTKCSLQTVKDKLIETNYLDDERHNLAEKRILVVGDNRTNRKILLRKTESWGMIVSTAENAAHALELIATKNKFDVAIIDMQMPEIDGLT